MARTKGFPVDPPFKVRPNLDPSRGRPIIPDPTVTDQNALIKEYNDFTTLTASTPFGPVATSPHYTVAFNFGGRITNFFSLWFGKYFKSNNTTLFVPNYIEINVISVNKNVTINHNPMVATLAGSATGIEYTSFEDNTVFSYSGEDLRSVQFDFYYNYKLPQVIPVYPAAAPAGDFSPRVMMNYGYLQGLRGFSLTK